MLVRRSRYAHLLRLGEGRALLVHALTGVRLSVDEEVAGLVDGFAEARDMPGELAALPLASRLDPDVLAGCLASLMEQGFLTALEPDAEADAEAARLAELHGRDPDAGPGGALDALRRRTKTGADAYWSVTRAQGAEALGRPMRWRLDVLLFGDCDLQMEADFLRQEGLCRGVAVNVATGFPGDARLAAERPHDAILVGALRARHLVARLDPETDGDPVAPYLAEARRVLEALRRASAAPILIDGLPEPTVQPLGLAERGEHGHRNRFRRLNRALEALAAEFADVHVVDAAAALGAAGAGRLLDDALVGWTHFGSPGWMLQRPASERAAVHGFVPDTAGLEEAVGGDPYGRERVMAAAHMDALVTLKAIDRKKVVAVDLDGVLWPGVLAETGAPFAWTPEVSGGASHIGLWFGIHEALLALKRRGVLLVALSKNDEAVLRRLWRYDDHYPRERLLTPDDFVILKADWNDKPSNLQAAAADLGFATDAFVFVDDHPVERERMRRALPEVETWGEDLYGLRRRLLTDPRLQTMGVTAEAAARTESTRAQLGRTRERAADAAGFLEGLQLVVEAGPADAETPLERVAELFARTTQFNTTGLKPSAAALAAPRDRGGLFVARARDRFGDYGLVAAAVVEDGEIAGLVMSCRVIGLGVERRLLQAMQSGAERLSAALVETERNGPVRHVYADAGFERDAEGRWRWRATAVAADGPLRRAG